MIPSPMQYLATHAIAFIAGAASLIAIRYYGRFMHTSGVRAAK
jgi:hypothetical protein